MAVDLAYTLFAAKRSLCPGTQEKYSERHRSRDSVTLDFYSALAPVHVASGAKGVSRNLPFSPDLLPAQACVGGGGGRDAEAMMRAGFDVDPTDDAPEIARKPKSVSGDLSA